MKKIVDSFLGIAKAIYDLEDEMTQVIDALTNCKSSAASEAIERITKAQKTLMSTPKKRVTSKPEIVSRSEEKPVDEETQEEVNAVGNVIPKPWENESA